MTHRTRVNGLKAIVLSAFFLLLFVAARCGAQDFSTGVRGGTSFNNGDQRFYQAEAFARINPPSWRWDFCTNWYLLPEADFAAGCLTDGHTDGFIGSLGPVIEIGTVKFPVNVEFGFSPTYMSRYHYGAKDFGQSWQFTSHIGLNWDVTKHFTIGWRMQHMSNGGLAEPNGGLDTQMLSFSLKF